MTNSVPPEGYGAYAHPSQPPRRSFRHRKPKTFWSLMVIGGLLTIGIIGSIASPPKDDSIVAIQSNTTSSAPRKAAIKPKARATKPAPATSSAEPAGPGIGAEVRDGKFAFTVTKIKCGVRKVGDNVLNARAQGQFCLVNLTVKNVGDEPQVMFSANQKGYIGDREYAVDDAATIYASGSSASPWLTEVNPGNSLTGPIVFDIPKGQHLTKLVLHDSAFSGGVEVNL